MKSHPFPPARRRRVPARTAAVLALLASALALAGCPFDKVPNPKVTQLVAAR